MAWNPSRAKRTISSYASQGFSRPLSRSARWALVSLTGEGAAQRHPGRRRVGAGFGRGDGLAAPAIEGLVEEQGDDAERFRGEPPEDLVHGQWGRGGLDRGVLPADDEVR